MKYMQKPQPRTKDANQTLHLWRAPSWAEIAAAEAKEKRESKKP